VDGTVGPKYKALDGADSEAASRRSMVMQIVNFFRLIHPAIQAPIPYALRPCTLYCNTILKYCHLYDDSGP
jgi:hypothetical protein